MAPLTFPNEKQMVSSEESGPAAGRGGGFGGQRGVLGGLLPRVTGRRGAEEKKETKKVFSAVGL